MRPTLQSKPADRTDAAAASRAVQLRGNSRRVQPNVPGESAPATAGLASTPRMVAQRKQLQAAFGDAIQREVGPEEEELQMKAAPGVLQRRGPEEEELLQGKFATVQKQGPEEDGQLQGRFTPVQRTDLEEEELLQGKFAPVQRQGPEEPHRVSELQGLSRARRTTPAVAPVQPKWIISKDGKREWKADDYELQEGERHEGPIRGVGTAADDLPTSAGLEGMPPLVMAKIFEKVIEGADRKKARKGLQGLFQSSKSVRSRVQATGQQFMSSVYHQPEKAIPSILPSVDAWAKGEGPPAEPKAKSELVYLMAKVDPNTELKNKLKEGTSSGDKTFEEGGGFFARERVMTEPTKKEKAAASKTEEQPAPTLQPLGFGLEYHPGGGAHSGRATGKFPREPVPTTDAMGGSYFKVERKKQGGDFRFARFGQFDPRDPQNKQPQGSGTVPFWQPLEIPRDSAEQEGVRALSAKALVEGGARASEPDAHQYVVESKRRLAARDRPLQQPPKGDIPKDKEEED